MTDSTLIERLKQIDAAGGWNEDNQICVRVPRAFVLEAIAALSPVLPDEVADALHYLKNGVPAAFKDRHKAADLIERLWQLSAAHLESAKIADAAVTERGQTIAQLEARIDELEEDSKKLITAEAQIEILNRENAQAQHSAQNWYEVAAANAEFDALQKLQARIDELANEALRYQDERNHWRDQMQEVQPSLDKADKRAVNMANTINGQERTINELQARIDELERDRATMAKTITTLGDRIDGRAKTIQLQLNYIGILRQDIRKLKKENSDLIQTRADLSTEAERLQDIIDQLEAAIDKAVNGMWWDSNEPFSLERCQSWLESELKRIQEIYDNVLITRSRRPE